MNRRSWFHLLLVGLMLYSPPTFAAKRTVFRNVNVLTMENALPLANRVVVVESGMITGISTPDQYMALDGDSLIDGRGGFLMPGLIDTHIHIDHPQDLEMMALFGVTSAINMRGLPWHLRLRQKIRSGDVFAPDFITGGDYLDGDPPDMLPMASVKGEMDARRAVRIMQRAGFDFIKVYSELSRAQYNAVCAESRKAGISVVGHLVDDAALEDVLACPHSNIAHGEQLFKLLEAREDPVEIRRLLEMLAEAGISLTVNRRLYTEMGRQPAELEQLLARPESALIHPATFQPWRAGINRYARRDEAWAGRVQKVYEDLGPITRIAQAVDATMLVAGSDMPVAGSYPGVSLIDEIETFLEAGLDGFEALATATVNAASLMRKLRPDYPAVGVIRAGARADLLLLADNPLDAPGTLRAPRGVMLRGQWFDAEKLAGIRSELVTKNEPLQQQVETLESAVFGGKLEQASKLFRKFRDQHPDTVLFAQYPFFFFGFSLLYDENGLTTDTAQAEKARLLYDMYRQTYPEFHSSHHVYGLALEAGGDVQGAIAAQHQALEIWPAYPPAVQALSRLQPEPETRAE